MQFYRFSTSFFLCIFFFMISSWHKFSQISAFCVFCAMFLAPFVYHYRPSFRTAAPSTGINNTYESDEVFSFYSYTNLLVWFILPLSRNVALTNTNFYGSSSVTTCKFLLLSSSHFLTFSMFATPFISLAFSPSPSLSFAVYFSSHLFWHTVSLSLSLPSYDFILVIRSVIFFMFFYINLVPIFGNFIN